MTMLDKIASSVEGDFWDRWSCGQPGPEWAIHAASAALTAMMEPSVSLFANVFYHATSTDLASKHEERYKAMIQAILNEGAEK